MEWKRGWEMPVVGMWAGSWTMTAGRIWRRLEHRGAGGKCWRRLEHRDAKLDTLEQVGGWLRALDGDKGKRKGGTWDGEGTKRPEGVGY